MKRYLKVVECAIEHNAKFLIIKRPEGGHAGGLLSFPGGKVDSVDEQDQWNILRAAAKREILEEVGLKLADDLKYILSNYFIDDDGIEIIDTLFHCEVVQTNLEVKASKREVAAYYWLTAEEIQHADNSPSWLKERVRYIIDSKN